MAWHDSRWNGRICDDPESNVYCVGPHSLLSPRIAREKNIKAEKENAGKKLDGVKDYLPPCFWTTNAFSAEGAVVTHIHPFPQYKHKKIAEELGPYSVFTWPFRHSFARSKEAQKRDGIYRKDLDARIEAFRSRISSGDSIAFFYLNYSNPISAEENQYALVGCSLISKISEPTHFEFKEEELARVRKGEDMQNFPTMNWALQVNYDREKTVVLPYHEYLRRVEENPEEESKLDEMRVLIQEDALVPYFKYVSEELDDDASIYLLYKLKKSVSIVLDHGLVRFDQEEKVLEDLLTTAWNNRALYPGVGTALELLADPEAEPTGRGDDLVSSLKVAGTNPKDILQAVVDLLRSNKPIPTELSAFSSLISEARIGLKSHSTLLPLLTKLSLFSLTKAQLRRIVFPGHEDEKDHPFGGKSLTPEQIVANPYLLCESYRPSEKETDKPELEDGPIGLFTIDIGMFPDGRYTKSRNYELQNLAPAGPERLRAVAIEYLKYIGAVGHCFTSLDRLYKEILLHPLFYKQMLDLNKEELVKGDHRSHFEERLSLVNDEGAWYFYLSEVKRSEEVVGKTVATLVGRKGNHKVDLSWIEGYLSGESTELEKKLKGFPEKQFSAERRLLLEGSLSKSFYVITGKPGSGKTQALRRVINAILEEGEKVTLLAPTGKATLRLKEETGFKEAQTIDMFLYRNGYGRYLEDLERVPTIVRSPKMEPIENLIIDECSMVDLQHFAVLLSLLDFEGGNAVKRLILVGDENQLPPIGFGKPFYDIVEFVRSSLERKKQHYVHLETNCRQAFDEKILKVADIFVGKNRYYEELFEALQKGGPISTGLVVDHWASPQELQQKVDARLEEVIGREVPGSSEGKPGKFNELFGLYPKGWVPKNSTENLKLDTFQIITPYNAGFYGTLGLNQYVRTEYKAGFYPDRYREGSLFGHSEKVIRLSNWYWRNRTTKERTLALSNGSIGAVCNKDGGRHWYFPERESPIIWIDSEENFEPAYAITVHKSQGSEFKNVFVVIPERRGLLSKELLYTALSRSTHRVNLFLQKSEKESPLAVGRRRSFVLERNSSIFLKPQEASLLLEPETGIRVRSRVEFIIYRSLMEAREKGMLTFQYEHELKFTNRSYSIHPDFTVWAGGKTYFWEHLGELDSREYFASWRERRNDYELNRHAESLITTDDLNGIKQERIQDVIGGIVSGKLRESPDSTFSKHHYLLYD
jgi:hypothetical protein